MATAASISAREEIFIGGEWVEPVGADPLPVVNSTTEETIATIPGCTPVEVDLAVEAARGAFEGWSQTPRTERAEAMTAIAAGLGERAEELAATIVQELGMPLKLTQMIQVGLAMNDFAAVPQAMEEVRWEEEIGNSRVLREPVGVVGAITPWNYPLHQIAAKVAPALAAGCTVVLKPSEVVPLNAFILAEVIESVGLPAGVFNLVTGIGPVVGEAIAAHPGVDMVSFTGSTRAGIEVAKNAAPTVKRICQELGGKSPNIILEDADMKTAIADGVRAVMTNSGQSCNAPTRMIVPQNKMEEVIGIAKTTADATTVGDPNSKAQIGPVVSEAQWRKVQGLIQRGIDEGATLVAGGTASPMASKRAISSSRPSSRTSRTT
jgi:aldehyde dehydrogenase (NAD+)